MTFLIYAFASCSFSLYVTEPALIAAHLCSLAGSWRKEKGTDKDERSRWIKEASGDLSDVICSGLRNATTQSLKRNSPLKHTHTHTGPIVGGVASVIMQAYEWWTCGPFSIFFPSNPRSRTPGGSCLTEGSLTAQHTPIIISLFLLFHLNSPLFARFLSSTGLSSLTCRGTPPAGMLSREGTCAGGVVFGAVRAWHNSIR